MPRTQVNGASAIAICVILRNADGGTQDATIPSMRRGGRIVVSGQIPKYNAASPRGVRNTPPFIGLFSGDSFGRRLVRVAG